MNKRLVIFSLAEYTAVMNTIWNHLGWAPQATSGLHDFPNKRPLLGPEIESLTFEKLKESGTTLIIKHIFKPFQKPKPDYYMRNYFDTGIRLLKLLLRENVPFVLDIVQDEDGKEELETLLVFSPPLFDRLFPGKAKI